MADLFDIIELTVDIPERGLRAGMQGTIVECHPGDACEVEFSNESGETVDLLALRPDQFIVVWQAQTRAGVPISEQIAALITHLPEDAEKEVLDFARFLRERRQRQPRADTVNLATATRGTSA
jgi:Domain of unknown function (DUF4926)/Protein of unknown function (DUF2281)